VRQPSCRFFVYNLKQPVSGSDGSLLSQKQVLLAKLCKPLSHLDATLTRNLASVASKGLTGISTSLESTLTKNWGGTSPLVLAGSGKLARDPLDDGVKYS
jgi:hypothetical protein